MKRRSLTLVVCLLATLSLASVGFAAWVISAGDVEYVTGNINVEAVTDERVFINDLQINGEAGSTGNFVFGKPASSAIAQKWLEPKNIENESLKLTITFTVDNKALTGSTPVTFGENGNTNLTATFEAYKEVTGNGQTEPQKQVVSLANAKTAGYILEDPTSVQIVSKGDNEFEIVIEFKWGSLFGTENPFEFYNANKATDKLTVDTNGIPAATGTEMTYGDHAAKYLAEMYAFFEDVKFSLTIEASHKE